MNRRSVHLTTGYMIMRSPTRAQTMRHGGMSCVLATVMLLSAGCGGSDDTGAPAGEDALPSDVLDIVSDGDGAPPGVCMVDEACRQSLSLGPCEEARCVDGGCERMAILDHMLCDDGDPCTTLTRCEEGVCTFGQPVVCDDGNACTDDSCDAVTGCLFATRSENAQCDDDDPCTLNDHCLEGSCRGDLDPECACTSDAECAAFQDGNLCNGAMRCEGGSCRLDPSSVVSCPAALDCQVSACVPSTGACTAWIASNGVTCDDGDPCSISDVCDEGQCVGGEAICECLEDLDCAPYQQGGYNLCLGPLTCVQGLCVPDESLSITCDAQEEDSCLLSACQPTTGLCQMVPIADGADCPAEGVCATPGACQQGLCVPAGEPCDDGDSCTLDTCENNGVCSYEFHEGPCDDGDPCTTGEVCTDQVCGGGNPASCDDLNPCTVDSCAPSLGGCVHDPVEDGQACVSGDPCLEGGVCELGTCSGQSTVTCEGGGPCTEVPCVPGEGCIEKPLEDGTTCWSGDLCDQEGTCLEANCESLPVSCNDGNPCTTDTCDGTLGGCDHVDKEDGAQCTSSDPCIENASCAAGECAGGSSVVCDNGPCDERACDPDTGICEIVVTKIDGTVCGTQAGCDPTGSCQQGDCTGETPCP